VSRLGARLGRLERGDGCPYCEEAHEAVVRALISDGAEWKAAPNDGHREGDEGEPPEVPPACPACGRDARIPFELIDELMGHEEDGGGGGVR